MALFSNVESFVESAEVYHRRKELSTSLVKAWINSPEEYYRRAVLGVPYKATDAMEFGTMVHEDQLVGVWERSWVLIPKEVLSSNGARRGKAWEAFRDANAGKVLVKEEQVKQAEQIREAIAANKTARWLLESKAEAISEISLVGSVDLSAGLYPEEESLGYRGRLDLLFPGRIVDLKTCSDLSPKVMQYRPFDHGWDLAAFSYSGLVEGLTGTAPPVDFIVVETSEPFRVEVYSPSQRTLDAAGARWWDAVVAIRKAIQTDWFHRPDYPDRIIF